MRLLPIVAMTASNEQQRSMPEDDWNTLVSDNQYYQSLAADTLESHGIKIFHRFTDRRYLRFVKSNGREFTIDKDKKKDLWGFILFNALMIPSYEMIQRLESNE